MHDWKNIIQIFEKYNANSHFVAECVYAQLAKKFYDLSKVENREDQKFMEELENTIRQEGM